jgi:hypothetical protein
MEGQEHELRPVRTERAVLPGTDREEQSVQRLSVIDHATTLPPDPARIAHWRFAET